MVGLVIVSHSRALAEAACALARGTLGGDLPLDFAGGLGYNRKDPGVDATDIMEAMLRVNSGGGVVVLMDLGNAAEAARLAEQLLGSDVPGVRLCPAPLVEGAVAAAALIAADADVDAVCCGAKDALAEKYADMEEELGADSPVLRESEQPEIIPADALRLRFRVTDPEGLHLRPAAKLVAALEPFSVAARIRNYDADGAFLNAAGVNQIALANIRAGETAEIAVWGSLAAHALNAVREIVREAYNSREYNPEEADTADFAAVRDEAADSAESGLVPLSPGVAVGTLYIHRQNREQLPPLPVADPEYEISRLGAALTRVRATLGELRDAEIREIQLLMLDDAGLLEQVGGDIRRFSRDAASCYQARMIELAAAYRALPNASLRDRATDVNGICDQVLDALQGKSDQDLSSIADLIVWAEEATPDLLARWAPGQLKGVLTLSGAPTSHVAIFARSMGIPVIAGYTPPREATTGIMIALDANGPEVAFNPGANLRRDFEARRDDWRRDMAEDRANTSGPAVTKDGRTIAVLANIDDAPSAAKALDSGAEGIGLLRTEALFLDRARAPEEREQIEFLAAVFDILGDRPVTVRTLDVGGDRRFGGVSAGFSGGEAGKSFLGVRGVRVYKRHPELLETQIRAILRAAAGKNAEIMIPMVSVPEEMDFCRAALEKCHAELAAEGLPHLWPVRMGILVETPAAALCAEALAEKADFFSIGTNDLTQYVMCAERGLAEVAPLADSRRPAVLEAIRLIAAAAEKKGIPVSVCGEMAGDAAAVPDLLRLGIRSLSMNSRSIGRIKKTIRAL